MEDESGLFDSAASQVVELANRLANENPEADLWEISDGLLAGAIHYWLFSHQPCGDPECEDCMPISTAQGRMAQLSRALRQFAEDSDYYHSPTDANVGRA